MKTVVVLATIFAAALALPADTYNPRYDNFNAQELVDNDRLLKSYVKCFLGKGPCTSEGSDFKRVIPEALRTKCAKCTPKQRQLIRVVVHGIQTKLPSQWDELIKKEDPTGEYVEPFKQFLSESQK
ncbi:allergen Tha p 1-like [Vanessa atalanta]|uniref:allergen Tha p 1-like n=1 Tax=Vanessa atalanta TaxID=42275 RepID=UPI001FCCDBB7|nr:allergen Tha p 1-like [Vanessa atalanta]